MKSKQIKMPPGDKRFLEGFRSQGQHSAGETTRAHILLATDAGVPTVQMQKVLGVSRLVIWRTPSAYREKGLDYAVSDAARPGPPAKYGTDQEAEVVALACSQAPEGAARWTIRLLTMAPGHRPKLAGVNRETIRQILKKTSVNLGAK
jgi:putative transposase